MVLVATVTYGSRYAFVYDLLVSLNEDSVIGKIIVFDNGSPLENSIKLHELCESDSKYEYLRSEKNIGSAGGFREVIEFAHKGMQNGDYLWLLDDDNLPNKDALKSNIDKFEAIEEKTSCISSLRIERFPYKVIFNNLDSEFYMSRDNSFLSFNVFKWVVKLRKGLGRSSGGQNNTSANEISLPYAPYGGLMIPNEILNLVSYPRSDFYLYRDDHEFTKRITDLGFKILLNRQSIVNEMESSFYFKRKWLIFDSFRSLIMEKRMTTYYIIRNSVFFDEKYYLKNPYLYHFNKFIYSSIYIIICHFLRKPIMIRVMKLALKNAKRL